MKKTYNRTRRAQMLVAIGFCLPLVTLFLATLLTYSSSRAFWEAFQWIPFSQRVDDALGDLLGAVEDIEMGQRGYLLTGKDDYLAPYTAARDVMAKHLERVEILTTGDSVLESHAARLTPLIEKKLALCDRAVAAKREGRDADALQLLLGDNSMQEVSGIIRKMRTAESGVRLSREMEAGKKARGTEKYLLWLLGLDVLVISIVIVLLLNLRRLEKFVTMCAWSKTVRHGGDWVPFEEYLRLTYDVQVSHGISEKEMDKFLAQAGLNGAGPATPAPVAG